MSREIKIETEVDTDDLSQLNLPKGVTSSSSKAAYEAYENAVIFDPKAQFANAAVHKTATSVPAPQAIDQVELQRLLEGKVKQKKRGRDEFWETYTRSHTAQVIPEEQLEADKVLGLDRAQEIDSGGDDFTLANYNQQLHRDGKTDYGSVLRESTQVALADKPQELSTVAVSPIKSLAFEETGSSSRIQSERVPESVESRNHSPNQTHTSRSESHGFFATTWNVLSSGKTWSTLGSLLVDIVRVPVSLLSQASTWKLVGKALQATLNFLTDPDTWITAGKWLLKGAVWLGKTLGEFVKDCFTDPERALAKLGRLGTWALTGLLWVGGYLGINDLVLGLAKTTWLLARAFVVDPARALWGSVKDSFKVLSGEMSLSEYFDRAGNRISKSLKELGSLASECGQHYLNFGSALLNITGLSALGRAFYYLSQGQKGMAFMCLCEAGLDIVTTVSVVGAVFTGGALASATATLLLVRKLGWKLASEKVFKAAATFVGKEALEKVIETVSKKGFLKGAMNITELAVRSTEKGAVKLAVAVEKKGAEVALSPANVERAMSIQYKKMADKVFKRADLDEIVKDLTGRLLTDIKHKKKKDLIAQLRSYGFTDEDGLAKLARRTKALVRYGNHDKKLKQILVEGITEQLEKGLGDMTQETFEKTFREILLGKAGTRESELLARAVAEKALTQNAGARAITAELASHGDDLLRTIKTQQGQMEGLVDEALGANSEAASAVKEIIQHRTDDLSSAVVNKSHSIDQSLLQSLASQAEITGFMAQSLRTQTVSFVKNTLKYTDDLARTLRNSGISDNVARDLGRALKSEGDSLCELATRQEDMLMRIIRNHEESLRDAVNQVVDECVEAGSKGARKGIAKSAGKFAKKGVAEAFKGFRRGRIFGFSRGAKESEDAQALQTGSKVIDITPESDARYLAELAKPADHLDLDTRVRVIDTALGRMRLVERKIEDGNWREIDRSLVEKARKDAA